MASYWFLCPPVCDVVAMSIEEGVLCLSNILLSALPGFNQVDHVPCLASGCSMYVEGCFVAPDAASPAAISRRAPTSKVQPRNNLQRTCYSHLQDKERDLLDRIQEVPKAVCWRHKTSSTSASMDIATTSHKGGQRNQ